MTTMWDIPVSSDLQRRRLCNQKIAGSNPASGYLATPFRKEIKIGFLAPMQ